MTCKCGCGRPTNVATKTNTRLGHIKGRSVNFLPGHHARGRKQSLEHRTNNAAAQRGRKLSDETKAKISASKRGKPLTPETRAKMSALRKGTRTGEANPVWKGERVGYRAIHTWVGEHKPRTGSCTTCGQSGKTDWANIDHEYHRDLDDYIELCVKCHRAYDRELKERR